MTQPSVMPGDQGAHALRSPERSVTFQPGKLNRAKKRHGSNLGDNSVERTVLSAAGPCGGPECPPHRQAVTRFAPSLNRAQKDAPNRVQSRIRNPDSIDPEPEPRSPNLPLLTAEIKIRRTAALEDWFHLARLGIRLDDQVPPRLIAKNFDLPICPFQPKDPLLCVVLESEQRATRLVMEALPGKILGLARIHPDAPRSLLMAVSRFSDSYVKVATTELGC